jgi:hypothetical protein
MGKGDNECYSETKKHQRWGRLPGDQRLEWSMKLHVIMYGRSYTPSISVICSKWYIRKAPFVLRAQLLDLSLVNHCCLA